MEQLNLRMFIILLAGIFKTIPFLLDWSVAASVLIVAFSLMISGWALLSTELKLAFK